MSVILLCERINLEKNKQTTDSQQKVESNRLESILIYQPNPALTADYPRASLWSMTRIGKRSSGFDLHRWTEICIKGAML